jgi:crotonobetainyl-CoA:carnitine CoA-transferase CaiB-like acyl-CoA transferase
VVDPSPLPGVPQALPFGGMRLLDVTDGIAGAYASKLLIDAGADAIVVEPAGGDPLRRWTAAATPLPPGTDGPLWRFLRSSAHATTDQPDALAAGADIILASYTPGRGYRAGLDPGRFAELRAANPALVVVSISPWGTTGPWADRPATEMTVQAACGGTSRRGLPDRPPVSAGGQLVEWLTGVFAAVGAATAYGHARRTGRGQHVDVSMLEAATLCLNGPYAAIAGQWYPDLPSRRTIEVPSIEPAADGQVGFCTMTAQQWSDFCVLIGHPEMGEDPTLRSADERMLRMDEIQAAVAAMTSSQTVDQIVELAVALRVPVTPVGTGATVAEFDQFVARETYLPAPGGGRWPRPPYRLSAAPLRPPGPPPPAGPTGWPGPRSEPGNEAADRPLTGLRVVDLSAFWAGPFATLYLAAMGADVIKVESTQHPDGIRFLGGFSGEAPWERSMVFAGANPSKRDITLDLEDPTGRDLLDRLIDGADVVVENFTPRVLDRFGIRWPELHASQPQTILIRMPAFGLEGPWRDRAGFAMTIEQTSGLAWVTGYPDVPLVPRGPCDPIGGMHAVLALLAALEHRRRTGEGQLIEVALVDGALNLAVEQVLEFDRTGEVLTRHGNRGPAAVPQGLYPAAGDDNWVAVAVSSDEQWHSLVTLVPGLEDDAWATPAGRRVHHDAIDGLIAAWTARWPAEECADRLVAAGVPAAVVAAGYRAHLSPQLAHRRFFQELDHPVTGRTGYPGFPMAFDAFGRALFSSPPPLLGQHNAEILRSLGLDPAAIEALEQRGVIGDRPAWL